MHLRAARLVAALGAVFFAVPFFLLAVPLVALAVRPARGILVAQLAGLRPRALPIDRSLRWTVVLGAVGGGAQRGLDRDLVGHH